MMLPYFHVLHLLCLFLLVGITFAAFAAPKPENRRRFLMLSGICSLGVFITGFGLAGIQAIGFPSWLNVKILAWLLLSGIGGIAFRKPEKIKLFVVTTIGIIVLALYMVYVRP